MVAVVVIGLVGWMVQARWSRSRGFLLVLGLVVACHLVVEGPRLPLAVAYLAAVLLLARALLAPPPADDAGARHSVVGGIARWVAGLVAIPLIIVPPVLLPVFRLPKPTGP